MKGNDHVQIHDLVAGTKTQEEETHPPTAPTRSPKELLEKQEPRTQEQEETVTAEPKTIHIRERYRSVLLPGKERSHA